MKKKIFKFLVAAAINVIFIEMNKIANYKKKIINK